MLSHVGLVIGTSPGWADVRVKAGDECFRDCWKSLILARGDYRRVLMLTRSITSDVGTFEHPLFVFISHNFSTINGHFSLV